MKSQQPVGAEPVSTSPATTASSQGERKPLSLQWTQEQAQAERGYQAICGVDEAGRGPFAGPVVAAAVILPTGWLPEGLNDSKKLTEKKREALYEQIVTHAIAYEITMVSPEVIDEVNILQATFIAMQHAVEHLSIPADFALIDGNHVPTLQIPAECIIGGDAISPSIAAASILAKVTRDRYMVKLGKVHPQYQLEKHKGYGTKAHCDAILEHGAVHGVHRHSFLKKLQAKHPEVTIWR